MVTDVLVDIEASKITSKPSRSVAVIPPWTSRIDASSPSSCPPKEDLAAKKNLKRAWSKREISSLVRLIEDPCFLQELIPEHPPGSIDFELMSRQFGRYSPGGTAV